MISVEKVNTLIDDKIKEASMRECDCSYCIAEAVLTELKEEIKEEHDKNTNGCHNCKNNHFGICWIYEEPNESDLIGVSVCNYEHWELE